MGESSEVSLAALRSFQELVSEQVQEEGAAHVSLVPTLQEQIIHRGESNSMQTTTQTIWKTAWKVGVVLYGHTGCICY